jgi:hypothetical protein
MIETELRPTRGRVCDARRRHASDTLLRVNARGRPWILIALMGCSSFGASSVTPEADAGDAGRVAADFCKKGGGFICADFDDPGASPFETQTVGDGVIDVGPFAFVSPPNGAHLTLATPPDQSCHDVAFRSGKREVSAQNGFVAEYKMKMAAPPAKSHAAVGAAVRLEDDSGGGYCEFYLRVTPNGAELLAETSSSSAEDQAIPLSRKPVAGRFSAIVIDVHGEPGGREVSVAIDGEPALLDAPLAPECQNGTRLTNVDLGLHCITSDVGSDLDIVFDDLRVNVR